MKLRPIEVNVWINTGNMAYKNLKIRNGYIKARYNPNLYLWAITTSKDQNTSFSHYLTVHNPVKHVFKDGKLSILVEEF